MIKKILYILLNKLKIILQLDIHYFAKNSLINTVQQTIGIISGLTISYFFGHFSSKKLFGDYNLVLSVPGFLTVLSIPGLDEYLTRSIAQKYDSLYLRSVKVKFLTSLIGTPILLLIGSYYLIVKNNQSLGSAFLISSFFFPFFHPIQLFNEFFTAKMRFKIIAIILSFSSLLSAILISTSIVFSQSLQLIIISYFAGIILPSLIAFKYSLKMVSPKTSLDRDLIGYGVFITFLNILPWSAGYLGQIILATSLGTELLAVFVVANKIPMYIQNNLFVFYKPLTAKLDQQSNKLHLITLKKHSLKLLLWGVLLAVPIYLFSPFIIKIIFTDKYSESISIAQVLSLAVIPLPFVWVINDILIFQKIKKPRLVVSFITNSLKIILYILLIPIFQLKALVWIFIIDRYLAGIVGLLLIIWNNRYYNRFIKNS